VEDVRAAVVAGDVERPMGGGRKSRIAARIEDPGRFVAAATGPRRAGAAASIARQ